MSHAYKHNKVTPALRRKIIAMRQKGATLERISGTLKVSRVNARAVVLAAGLPVRPPFHAVPVTPELLARAIREYKAGMSFNRVARQILHKRNEDAVTLLVGAGVKLRPFRGNGRGEWRNREKPTFSAPQAALCRAVLSNGLSLKTAVKLYGGGISEEEAACMVERFRSEGVTL